MGYKFLIINIQSIVLFQSTNILISNVSAPEDVTTYNIAYKLLSAAMMLYSLITAPLWPAYTDAYVRADYLWMQNMWRKMKRILLLSIFGCGLVTMVSPWIYDIWMGNKVEIPFLMTFMVAIYVSIYCWSSLNGTLIVGMGKLKLNSRICLVGMFLHIPLSYLLSHYIGTYGVVSSMIIINAFYAIVQNIQVRLLLNKRASGIWNE